MKRIGILGHFAFGQEKNNGQTIKTKIVTEELQKVYGKDAVGMEDSVGRWRFLLRLPMVVLRLLINYQNIIIMPAYKGVCVISPLLVLGNFFFHRRLHYIVIGGWLPLYVQKYPLLRFFLKKFYRIYVETNNMQQQIEAYQIRNIVVMPNFKPLNVLDEPAFPNLRSYPLRLCTFSRVMKRKGIEEAISAVLECNQQMGREVYTLDIYGPIEHGENAWFEQLMSLQPSSIRYGGVIPFLESTAVLSNYFTLVFPTLFKTEGFAGTIIDAMATGLPPIASDCPSNCELIRDGETGLLFSQGSVDALKNRLLQVASDPSIIDQMRSNCLREAERFLPEEIIKSVTLHIL